MQTSRLPHLITRSQRLRQMIDTARRQSSSPFDILRIQALLLKAQQQLAEALLPVPAPQPIPVRVRNRLQ